MYKSRAFHLSIFIFFLLILSLTAVVIQKRQITNQHASGPQGTPSSLLYYGAFVEQSNPKQTDLSLLQKFETDAQKGVAISHWFEWWGGTGAYTQFPTPWMNMIRTHGSIPMITWQPMDVDAPNDPAYTIQNTLNGKYDSYITQFADASKAWGHPYFLRFAHEMNGNWYAWSEQVNGNSKGQYVQLWKHVHDIFTKEGVTNVTWVWCPSSGIDYAGLKELYPGDSYVDWTCLDGYNYGNTGWKTFTQIFGSTYKNLLQLTNKPVMIGETASTEHGGSKPQWITNAITTEIPTSFPQIKALLWFDSTNKGKSDWLIESSAQSQAAFAAAIQNPLYMGNMYSTLDQSPIPPANGSTSSSPTPSIKPGSPTPTRTPSLTPGASTSPAGGTQVAVTVCLHGLGNCGDNANPTGGNTSMLHPQRTMTLALFDATGKTIVTTKGTVIYNSTSQNFQGTVGIGTVASGSYLAAVKVDGYLSKQTPGIITVSQGKSITLPILSLTTGDINNDNQLDILDYNLLISCFGSKADTSSCQDKTTSDLTDDGSVDGGDYNLFLRELSVQHGV